MKLKSLKSFQNENQNSLLLEMNLKEIKGGVARTTFAEGTCTGDGSDCRDMIFWDDGSFSHWGTLQFTCE